ncbi:MAG TPA: DUF3021 family protein [Feifaniaceae bacterium]|nr:DUF3021 family protein [Feifaniaceae bacterium]
MSFRSFLKQCAMEFFIITTCVNVATALIGPVLHPQMTFGFQAFYSPVISGILGTLPSIILYSKKELNFRQTIIRKILHLIALEALLTGFAWLNGNLSDIFTALLFIGMVFLVYLAVNLIGWTLESREAKHINEGLKALQNRE